ncbi:cytochrome c [Noviherbaspirillum cavernae]|uniref:Cytochrome c n=1 Tax=Noviherbaspirillum cavernae TaxID=2320862 RepID=A0A418WVN8_9BURK|nr:cytochrome c [Noviherbaspirillum cavernae]RJF96737.1 cytochrome c [Noviherbaspirillum cavernae]
MRRNKTARGQRGLAALFLLTALSLSVEANAQAGREKAAQCFTCHGADGIAKTPDAPNLAGQNEAYLVKAINDYKSGARKHEIMAMMTRNLSAAEIGQLAAYYSRIEIVVKVP